MRATETVAAAQKPAPAKREVRVGIVGYGTVGRATAEILAGHAAEITQRTGGVAVSLTRISRRTPRASESGSNGAQVVQHWRDVVDSGDVDIVVEAVGGTAVAYEVVRAALENGKP